MMPLRVVTSVLSDKSFRTCGQAGPPVGARDAENRLCGAAIEPGIQRPAGRGGIVRGGNAGDRDGAGRPGRRSRARSRPSWCRARRRNGRCRLLPGSAASARAMTSSASAISAAAVGPPIWSATTFSASRVAPSRSIVFTKFAPCAENTQEVRRIACGPPPARTAVFAGQLGAAVGPQRPVRSPGRQASVAAAVEDVIGRDMQERGRRLRRGARHRAGRVGR